MRREDDPIDRIADIAFDLMRKHMSAYLKSILPHMKDQLIAGFGHHPDNKDTRSHLIRRNAKILQAHQLGASVPELAKSFFLSESQIKRIVKGEP